jgi:hypothetical protein
MAMRVVQIREEVVLNGVGWGAKCEIEVFTVTSEIERAQCVYVNLP